MSKTSPTIADISAKTDALAVTGTGASFITLDKTNSRMGIGTPSPGDILDINGGSSVTTPTVRTTGTGVACGWRIESATDGTGNIYFGDAADGAQGRII